MAFSLISGGNGTLRTQASTPTAGTVTLYNSAGELTAVGYDRLPTNVTLTAAVTGSSNGGSSAVITVSSGTQFATGDKIYITGSTFPESATVQSVAGNNLTLANVPYFNHNIGEVIHRFTNNQTLCVAVLNPVGDYTINSLQVTINGTATDLLKVENGNLIGTSTIAGAFWLYVLPILSPQTNVQSTGYTVNFNVTNGAGNYESIHFNALTFTGAYIPASVANANLAKSAGGTLLDGSSGTFGNAAVNGTGTPKRVDLGTVPTTYSTQQQPFVAVMGTSNTTLPANYFRTLTNQVAVDASNNVTGILNSAITCTGTAGASTITVSSRPDQAGFIPNGVYVISDGANTETIQLTGNSVGSSTTLNLVSPLASSHTAKSITPQAGFAAAGAMITPWGTGNLSQAWATAGSPTVYTASTTFLPANGTQLYIHANGVGEFVTVLSGQGTNTLTMTSNLTRSYQNGIISTTPAYFNVVSPYGGYTIQANSLCAPATAAVLSVASGTGTKTSLSVNALPVAISSGTTLLLRLASNPATTQSVTLSAAASAGATTISITSVSFATNFPIGTTLANVVASAAPLSGQNGGLIGTTLYPPNASVNNLTAFTQPAGQIITITAVPLIATTAGQSSATSSTINGTTVYPTGSGQFQNSATIWAPNQFIKTGVAIGGTNSGYFLMFAGYNYGGTPFITPSILNNTGGVATTFNSWGLIYTFVPATPTVTQYGKASQTETLESPSQRGVNYVYAIAETLTSRATRSNGRNLVYALTEASVSVATTTRAVVKSAIATVVEALGSVGQRGKNETFATTQSLAVASSKQREVNKSSAIAETLASTSAREADYNKSSATTEASTTVGGRVTNRIKSSSVAETPQSVGIPQNEYPAISAVAEAPQSEGTSQYGVSATSSVTETTVTTSGRETDYDRTSSTAESSNASSVGQYGVSRSGRAEIDSATSSTTSAGSNQSSAVPATLDTRATKSREGNKSNATPITSATRAAKSAARSASSAVRLTLASTGVKQGTRALVGFAIEYQVANGVITLPVVYSMVSTVVELMRTTSAKLTERDRTSAISEAPTARGASSKGTRKSASVVVREATNAVTRRSLSAISKTIVTQVARAVKSRNRSVVSRVAQSQRVVATRISALATTGFAIGTAYGIGLAFKEYRGINATYQQASSEAVGQHGRTGVGNATARVVARATKSRERYAVAISALSQAVRAGRQTARERVGDVVLTQIASVTYYLYKIAETIGETFSEIYENGVYGETPKVVSSQDQTNVTATTPSTLQGFTEDGVALYQEGRTK